MTMTVKRVGAVVTAVLMITVGLTAVNAAPAEASGGTCVNLLSGTTPGFEVMVGNQKVGVGSMRNPQLCASAGATMSGGGLTTAFVTPTYWPTLYQDCQYYYLLGEDLGYQCTYWPENYWPNLTGQTAVKVSWSPPTSVSATVDVHLHYTDPITGLVQTVQLVGPITPSQPVPGGIPPICISLGTPQLPCP